MTDAWVWTPRVPGAAPFSPFGAVLDGNGDSVLVANYVRYPAWSSDYGVNWAEHDMNGMGGWICCACSIDGTHLTVGASPGCLFTSSDGGANWTEIGPYGAGVNRYWRSIDCSDDGSFIILADGYQWSGRIWISTDYGANWTEKQPAGYAVNQWMIVACDADGSVLAAKQGATDGYIYLSTNSGTNWTVINPTGIGTGSATYTDIAINGDGSVIIVCASRYAVTPESDRMWMSTDSGTNWTEVRPSGADEDVAWRSVACSASGTTIIAVHAGYQTGGIWDTEPAEFYTDDGGATWTETVADPVSNLFERVRLDEDGNRAVILGGTDGIYTGRRSMIKKIIGVLREDVKIFEGVTLSNIDSAAGVGN
jgi:hypothetical protein